MVPLIMIEFELGRSGRRTAEVSQSDLKRDLINRSILRLRWLMRLRWLALAGVSAAAGVAVIGLVPGVNLMVLLSAVLIGTASNVYIRIRLGRLARGDSPDVDGLHVGQALLDTLVLTLVLWSAGGADCPFTSFYVFPMLLAVLLSARRNFWATATASFLGLLWQELSCIIPELRVGVWNPEPAWVEPLNFSALVLTIAIVTYFAARFTDAIREQVQAKRASDELLRLSLEQIDAGVELLEAGDTVWQNPFAVEMFGDRCGSAWRCPGALNQNRGSESACAYHEYGCHLGHLDGGARCRFTLKPQAPLSERVPELESAPIFEVMLLSSPQVSQRVAIYIDQTEQIDYVQKLLHTERLASLGRTAQGVAHELNTPLATIQTLGRDVLDVIELLSRDTPSAQREELSEDLRESTQVILDEVKRCSRITHALLGRSHTDRHLTQIAHSPISDSIERAIALVFPHTPDRVQIKLGDLGELSLPFDPLVQIFVNLIQNAWDSLTEHALKSQTALDDLEPIEISGERSAEGELQIYVSDRGGGLTGEPGVLFEPFYTTKSPGQGTGLGLYTSYALARELGGAITLRGRADRGAVACLSIPLTPPP